MNEGLNGPNDTSSLLENIVKKTHYGLLDRLLNTSHSLNGVSSTSYPWEPRAQRR